MATLDGPSDAPELGKPEGTPRELRTASLDRSLLNRSPEEMLEKIKAYVEPIRLTTSQDSVQRKRCVQGQR